MFTAKVIEVKAPAKVNLFLEVVGKRPDGYHDLESIVQAVSIYDEVSVSLDASGASTLECNIKALETPQNLALRAASAFKEAAGLSAGVHIRLEKVIPIQGGLGGGSSDAAAVLLALNDLAGLPLDAGRLLKVAAGLGSDVPFFIKGGTALVTGRGEHVDTFRPGAFFHFVVFFPGFGISTAEVYKNLTLKLTENRRNAKVLRELLTGGNLPTAQECFFNRLEETAYELDRRLGQAKAAMQARVGDSRIVLCGSGASLFSAFVDYDTAYGAYRAVKGLRQGEVFLANGIRGE